MADQDTSSSVAIGHTLGRAQARLDVLLEAAEAALADGDIGGHLDAHEGPCRGCGSWGRLRAAVEVIRQAEAER